MRTFETVENKIDSCLKINPTQRYKNNIYAINFEKMIYKNNEKARKLREEYDGNKAYNMNPSKEDFNEHIRIFKTLNDNNVGYLLIGGMASILYGVSVKTYDIDIAFESTISNAELLIKSIKEIFGDNVTDTTSDILIQYSMATIVNANPILDLFSVNSKIFNTIYNRREILNIDNVEIPVMSLDDLISEKSVPRDEKEKEVLEWLKIIKNKRQ